jgi:hypothetical protein
MVCSGGGGDDNDDNNDDDSKDRYDHDNYKEGDKQQQMAHKILMYNLPVQAQTFRPFTIFSSKAHT